MKKFIFILILFTITNNNAYSNTDCSQLKKLTKKYIGCLAKKSKEKTSNISLDTTNIKEKKYISDWFKKKNEF